VAQLKQYEFLLACVRAFNSAGEFGLATQEGPHKKLRIGQRLRYPLQDAERLAGISQEVDRFGVQGKTVEKWLWHEGKSALGDLDEATRAILCKISGIHGNGSILPNFNKRWLIKDLRHFL
jgi:hypothetical protein